MKYKEQLIALIIDENDDALMEWIEEQPELEQPDIFRELKELTEEIAAENGDNLNDIVEGFDEIDKQIDAYEDSILDEKLAEVNYIMALEAQEKAAKEIEEATKGVRAYVIECIISNAPNAAEMRALANQLIKLEIDAGTHNPEDWSAIL